MAWLLLGAMPVRAATLELLTYNTWLRPRLVFPGDAQGIRARRLARALAGYDVLVLSEVFDRGARRTLLRDLAGQGYYYTSRSLGRDQLFTVNGGVLIASRWPILAQARLIFDACANTDLCLGDHCLVGDCNARKGVVYVAIQKAGHRFHLFGLHAQAGERPTARAARARQLETLREFIDSRRIPAGEPVIIAGDLNVDRVGATEEYCAMLALLGVASPRTTGGLPYSFDPETNLWAQRISAGEPRQVIDHVLVSGEHLSPEAAQLEVRPVREGGLDLSDHHAVYARLDFPDGPAAVAAQRSWAAEPPCNASPARRSPALAAPSAGRSPAPAPR